MPARPATRPGESITLICRAIPQIGIQITHCGGLITTTSSYIAHDARVVSPITCDITTHRARITPLGIRVTLVTVHIALIGNIVARVGNIISAPRGHVPLRTIDVALVRHAITRLSNRIATIGIRVALWAIDDAFIGDIVGNVIQRRAERSAVNLVPRRAVHCQPPTS